MALNNEKAFELAVMIAAPRVVDWKEDRSRPVHLEDRIAEEIRRCYKAVKKAADVM